MAKGRSRGNGEGTVYKRGNDSWAAQYHVQTPTGRKRRTVYAKSRKEAAEKLAKAISDRAGGIVNDAGNLTVGEYLKAYLADVEARVRPKTHRRYQDLTKCHIHPALGRVKLKALSPAHLRALYAERLESGYAPRTVGHAHTLIKQALKSAVADGLAPRNVAEAVRPPRANRREVRPLTPRQTRSLLTAARGDPYEALYAVAVTAGLRRGELLGLAWEDLDTDRGVLAVRRTLQKGELLPPKTAKGRRQIRLTVLAADALVRHRKKQDADRAAADGAWTERSLVFPNRSGKPTDGDNLCSRHFKPLLRRAGLPEVRFHDLRHTCATLLLTKGVHPKVVSEMLGHANVSITLDTYSHVIPGLGDAAAGAMDDLLRD